MKIGLTTAASIAGLSALLVLSSCAPKSDKSTTLNLAPCDQLYSNTNPEHKVSIGAHALSCGGNEVKVGANDYLINIGGIRGNYGITVFSPSEKMSDNRLPSNVFDIYYSEEEAEKFINRFFEVWKTEVVNNPKYSLDGNMFTKSSPFPITEIYLLPTDSQEYPFRSRPLSKNTIGIQAGLDKGLAKFQIINTLFSSLNEGNMQFANSWASRNLSLALMHEVIHIVIHNQLVDKLKTEMNIPQGEQPSAEQEKIINNRIIEMNEEIELLIISLESIFNTDDMPTLLKLDFNEEKLRHYMNDDETPSGDLLQKYLEQIQPNNSEQEHMPSILKPVSINFHPSNICKLGNFTDLQKIDSRTVSSLKYKGKIYIVYYIDDKAYAFHPTNAQFKTVAKGFHFPDVAFNF
jgi:hypothetical protein